MLKKILLALIVLMGLFAIFVSIQPADFKISRSAKISAPASVVFEQVNDFHKWDAWSPWAKLDPNAKNTLSGEASGKGAVFAWAGNKEVGEGKMTIVESRPSELIQIKLEFIKPFPGISTTEFTFKPEGDQTVTTWTMSGKNNFIGKMFSLFMNCDKMVGGSFEKGLAQIKTIAESSTKK